jgi:hypothetical protein
MPVQTKEHVPSKRMQILTFMNLLYSACLGLHCDPGRIQRIAMLAVYRVITKVRFSQTRMHT